ncbi:DUF6480 family protein [Streptomyces deccanensis]|uniref:DUF6480 family protein n=1 Tax=Streptomyces deccanensis TaxID=424188 RepID=UPI001EFB1E65|nr:DUF6480 family protein [Streptomyces deccanensis]ULR54334.1 DUF6480 family protein [Streptomyces deccanensis]
MTSPDPGPRRTPGADVHGGVPPGETPPGEGGTSGISHPEPPAPRTGWGSMSLVLMMVVVALIVVGLVGMAVVL